MSEVTDDFMAKLNDVFASAYREMFHGAAPHFRGYVEGSIWYCWNTEPLTPSAKTRNRQWAAFKYRHNKEKGTFTQVGKAIYFARRKSAKSKAYTWYHKKVLEHKQRGHVIAQAGGE